MAAGCGVEFLHQGIGQFAGQRHAPAIPAGYGGFTGGAAAYISGHVLHPHKLEYPPGEHQGIAWTQAGDEGFLDTAQMLAAAAFAPIFELQVGVADDGADAHAVAPRQALADDPPYAIAVGLDALVIGVGTERAAAVADEVQCPLPLAVAQIAKSPGATYLGE
ncbi:hypothetical protein D3C79_599580 [compost metagenome]